MALTKKKDNSLGDLVGYFYASMTWHLGASAIYYKVGKDKYGEYISEFSSSPPERNWTGNVLYVENHEHFTCKFDCLRYFNNLSQLRAWTGGLAA